MTEQKRLGTLIVIAMEARNLSTRDIIGKGDPFVAFHIDGDSKRTKADKRGGQHPKWDEEVRFNVMKDTAKKLKIQVFNDDKREPVIIGDATIDLTEVLDKTEWDEWHQINYRNKYAGEVSLEMTFYYDGPPPQNVIQNQKMQQHMHHNSLPPQSQNSYPNPNVASPPVGNKPLSAPSGYPPSNVYPPTSISPSPNIYPPPPNSTSPPQSQQTQFFGPKRTQSPVSSSQYPPASSSGFQPFPPPQQSQGYPPVYPPVSSPPFRPTTQHDSSQGANLAFPTPIPTPMTNDSSFGAYPPPSGAYPPRPPSPLPGYQQAYPPNNNPYPPNNNPYPPNNNPYPANNIYPPAPGGNVYPPPQNTYNQGYPPNPYPPSGNY